MVELSDIEALIAEAEEDRQRAHAAADAKYESTVAAINVVKAMLERRAAYGNGHAANGEAPSRISHIDKPSNPPQPEPTQPVERLSLRRTIRRLVERHEGSFNLDDVMKWLDTHHPGHGFSRVAASGELYQLNKRNEIRTVQKGSGNLPNTYERVKGGEQFETL